MLVKEMHEWAGGGGEETFTYEESMLVQRVLGPLSNKNKGPSRKVVMTFSFCSPIKFKAVHDL